MSSQFTRLYRELKQKTPSGKVYDTSYEREREDVMARLGHGVGRSFTEQVKSHVHHGKIARHRRDSHQLSIQECGTAKKDLKLKKSIVTASAESTRISAITKKMEELMKSGQPVPDKLIRQLAVVSPQTQRHFKCIEDMPGVQFIADAGEANATAGSVTGKRYSKENMAAATAFNDGESVISRNGRLICRAPEPSYSCVRAKNVYGFAAREELRWSVEERDTLNRIYLETPTPTQKRSKELWELYLQAVARRFLTLYPQRGLTEVVEKARAMIAHRRMKEKGETLYWSRQQASRESR